VDHLDVLRSLTADGILDVGANRGQFTLACRLAKPGVPVVAFEPIPAEAAVFRLVHGSCSDIQLIETALGPEAGNAALHMSHRADSSSLLPIGEGQRKIFEGTDEVGTINVPVNRLDAFQDRWAGRSRLLLKLDVQGFELKVLEGAVETLTNCAYVYAECSEKELYVGQALFPEVSAFLSRHGFELSSRHNEMVVAGESIQADYLFERR
jgi:FkbM family methyltransferase